MGILSRFRDIMASNINALLDQAEDPVKRVDEFMRSVRRDLGQVQVETAAVLAAESRALRAWDACTAEVHKLEQYALKAAEAGNDADARKFLQRKAMQAEKAVALQAAYESAAANTASMKQLRDKLMSDRDQMEVRFAHLKGKIAATRVQQRINDAGSPAGDDHSVFDSLEESVNSAYDEAMAIAELRGSTKGQLDEHFASDEKKETVEQELASLKQALNQKD